MSSSSVQVRETLQDVPGRVEEFLGVLYDFEQSSRAGESRSAVELFAQLKPVLREWPDLLRDFAAFLLPDQALECGLVSVSCTALSTGNEGLLATMERCVHTA